MIHYAKIPSLEAPWPASQCIILQLKRKKCYRTKKKKDKLTQVYMHILHLCQNIFIYSERAPLTEIVHPFLVDLLREYKYYNSFLTN